jgi:diguanylate cyclase (GGDEF)-like protein
MEQATRTLTTSPPRPPADPDAEAYLLQTHPAGPGPATCFRLGGRAVEVGRGDAADLAVADAAVSRRHARLDRRPDGYHVTDLGSTNGTLVNGVRVATAALRDGDSLRVGNSVFRFLRGGSVEAEDREGAYRRAALDPLTGAHNRRSLREFLGRELARSARHGRPLALVLFDLDRFKAVNGRLGHRGGDAVLRGVALRVRAYTRTGDPFARVGGEEFAAVLPEAGRGGAAAVAERIRTAVRGRPFACEGVSVMVTVSLGVGTTAGGEWLTPDELIRRADERLFAAKRDGRDRVVS